MHEIISFEEYSKFGCPSCGDSSAYKRLSVRNTRLLTCGNCNIGYTILDNGATQSDFGKNGDYPKLQFHPRRKSVNLEPGSIVPISHLTVFTSSCFICGEAAERNLITYPADSDEAPVVETLIGNSVLTHHRPPKLTRILVGCCDKHQENLAVLKFLLEKYDGELSPATLELVQ